MSNIIPPLLSDSPPPPPLPTEDDDEEDDEFGHFGRNDDISFAYGCDNLSLSSSPINLPDEDIGLKNRLDINSNSKENINDIPENKLKIDKDFHDKRKDSLHNISVDSSDNNGYRNKVVQEDTVENILKLEKAIFNDVGANSFSIKPDSETILAKNNVMQIHKEVTLGQATDNTIESIKSVDNLAYYDKSDMVKESPPCEGVIEGCGKLIETRSNFVDNGNTLVDSDNLEKNLNITEGIKSCNYLNDEDDFGDFSNNHSSCHLEAQTLENDKVKNIHFLDGEHDNILKSQDDIENTEIKEFESKTDGSWPKTSSKSNSRDNNDFDNVISNSIEELARQVKDNVISEDDFDNIRSNYREDLEIKKNDNTNEQFTVIDDCVSDENLIIYKNVSKIQEFYSGHFDTISKTNIENGDDFGKFSVPDMDSNLTNTLQSESVEQQEKISNFTSFDADFGDFASPETGNLVSNTNFNISEKSKDNFDDDNLTSDVSKCKEQPDSNDDFGDFEEYSDFTESSPAQDFLNITEKEAFTKSELILKEVFIRKDLHVQDFEENKKNPDNPVFSQLKDITETKAMSYVWLKSSSQNMFLKALNIDVRNILFGPSWNSSMPRFAANLSLAPLEPIKSSVIVQSPVSTNPSIDASQPTNQNADIPNAEFDWSGSGLTNPFDSQLSKKSTNTKELSSEISPIGDDVSTSLPSYDASPFHVPLRETHITNKHTFGDSDHDSLGWLQPTIITPELSRKHSQTLEISDDLYGFDMTADDTVSPDKPVENVQKEELKEVISLSDNTQVEFALMSHVAKPKIEHMPQDNVVDEHDFDEFSDFQAAPLPHKPEISIPSKLSPEASGITNANIRPHISTTIEPLKADIITPTEPLKPFVIHPEMSGGTSSGSANISWPDPGGLSEDDLRKFEGIYSRLQREPPEKESLRINKEAKGIDQDKGVVPNIKLINQDVSEEEWSDFTCSDIKSTKPVEKPKPDDTKLFTAIFKAHAKHSSKNSSSNQEFVSKEERNIPKPVLNQHSKDTKSISYAAPSNFKPQKAPPVKANSLEDDDWSDFVSVKTQSPAHKRVTGAESRSSTPDLPLSVLNLGNIQPAKQPIPVITPQGLIQTKLSSGNVLNIQSVVQNNVYSQSSTSQPMVQPSLISNVYANQAYGGFSSHNTYPRSGNHQDDDEWSDFVSHQPTSSYVPHQRQSTNLPLLRPHPNYFPQLNPTQSWFSAPQQSFSPNQSNFNTAVLKNNDSVIQQNRTNSPALNISIPELDFVAPKSRTSNRK